MAIVQVDGAVFEPCMDSFLGAVVGVLSSQGDDWSLEHAWGLSGLAFRTQVHRTLAPAGLYLPKWDETYAQIMRRMGHDCIAGLRDFFYGEEDLMLLQGGWMRNIHRHLDEGLPAIAYGLHGPGFGIIHGFDDEAKHYLVSTAFDDATKEPVPVGQLGIAHPPCVFVMIPTGWVNKYDRAAAAVEALREIRDHMAGRQVDARGQTIPVPQDLAVGLEAYDAWAQALETGKAEPVWGAAYTAGYYVEARVRGADYLEKIMPAWHAPATDDWTRASAALRRQADHLRAAAMVLPIQKPQVWSESARRSEAAKCIGAARIYHEQALEALMQGLGRVEPAYPVTLAPPPADPLPPAAPEAEKP